MIEIPSFIRNAVSLYLTYFVLDWFEILVCYSFDDTVSSTISVNANSSSNSSKIILRFLLPISYRSNMFI